MKPFLNKPFSPQIKRDTLIQGKHFFEKPYGFYARQLTERVPPEQRLCVLAHGAVVLMMERVEGSGKRSGRAVRGREGRHSVVGQCRVDRRGFVNRSPVGRDETGERRVGRRDRRRGDNRRRG